MVPDQENVGSLLDKIAEYRTGVGMKYLEEAVRRVLEKGEFPAKGLMQLYGCLLYTSHQGEAFTLRDQLGCLPVIILRSVGLLAHVLLIVLDTGVKKTVHLFQWHDFHSSPNSASLFCYLFS